MIWDYDGFIADFGTSPLGVHHSLAPWEIVCDAADIIAAMHARLDNPYVLDGDVAVHGSSTVEAGAVIKGPAIIGPDCFIAAGAYLRGGCWLEGRNILGPGCELKSSFLFSGTKLAHFNFVGDSIIGHDANFEAGSIVANYRNETGGAPIVIRRENTVVETGALKFGVLAGDGTRLGANAVIAPGAILARNTIVPRLSLVDQSA